MDRLRKAVSALLVAGMVAPPVHPRPGRGRPGPRPQPRSRSLRGSPGTTAATIVTTATTAATGTAARYYQNDERRYRPRRLTKRPHLPRLRQPLLLRARRRDHRPHRRRHGRRRARQYHRARQLEDGRHDPRRRQRRADRPKGRPRRRHLPLTRFTSLGERRAERRSPLVTSARPLPGHARASIVSSEKSTTGRTSIDASVESVMKPAAIAIASSNPPPRSACSRPVARGPRQTARR